MKKIFTKFFMLATLFLASTNLTAQTYNNGTWYSLYDANGFNLETKITSFNGVQAYRDVFAPIGGNLTFNWQYSGWIAKSHDTYIYESSDGGSNYSGEKGHISGTGSGTGNVSLSANINKIKFDRPSGNTNTVKYTNIKLPLKKHILLASGDYGTTSVEKKFANPVTINETSSEVVTVKLRSFLTAGDISITSDNPAFYVATSTYAVGANACASANGTAGSMAGGGTLGNINNYDVLIYFHPTSTGTHSGTITLTDGTSKATIKVSGTCEKKAQTITWNDDIANIKTTDNITLNATGATAISYISSDNSIAEIVGNTLSIKKHGKVTITATAAETDIYASASQTKEVTISATTPEVTWPQVAPITYGTPLTFDMLVGGNANVPGNFECGELPTILNAGTHKISVRFVPENQNIYTIVEEKIDIIVNKADATITTIPNAINDLVYSGEEQTLITEGSAEGGRIVYSLDGNTFTEDVPTATNAGEYTVYYKIVGDENHNDVEETNSIVVIIKKATQSITWNDNIENIQTIDNITLNAISNTDIHYTSSDSTIAYVENKTLIINKYGIVTITAIAKESNNYTQAIESKDITISRATPSITWNISDTLTVGNSIHLDAVASNNAEVLYEIIREEGILKYDNQAKTLTAMAAGTTTILAYTEENDIYNAAEYQYTITVVLDSNPSTNITNTTINGEKAQKIFVNGKLYIIRNNQWYDTTGKLVK